MRIVGAIFEKMKIINFFLMWTILNFRGGGKARDIYEWTLYINFERDRSIGLGSTLDDGRTDGQSQTLKQTLTHPQTFL